MAAEGETKEAKKRVFCNGECQGDRPVAEFGARQLRTPNKAKCKKCVASAEEAERAKVQEKARQREMLFCNGKCQKEVPRAAFARDAAMPTAVKPACRDCAGAKAALSRTKGRRGLAEEARKIVAVGSC